MEKIKTIKEIVTTPIYNGSDKKVHFVGDIVTKKDVSFGKGKHKERTKILIKGGNFCIVGTISNDVVGNKYKELVNTAKIDKSFYFEGKINTEKIYGDLNVDITDIDSNVFLRRLEHEEETAEIKLFKYIEKGEESEAVKLLNENRNININFNFANESFVFSAINAKMIKLFETIINYPNYNFHLEDEFGETLLESMIYLYVSDEIAKAKYQKDCLEKFIKVFLRTNGEHFNATDINQDTAINVACEYTKAIWIVEALLEKEGININIVNDFNCTALGSAIRYNNIEAIKLLAKRSDLIVRDEDVKMAEKFNINLVELGIDISKTKTCIVNEAAERYKEFAEVCKG